VNRNLELFIWRQPMEKGVMSVQNMPAPEHSTRNSLWVDYWLFVMNEWLVLNCRPDLTACNVCLWAVGHFTEADFSVTVRKATDRNLIVWELNVGEVKHCRIQCSGADCTSRGHKTWKFRYYRMLFELILFKIFGLRMAKQCIVRVCGCSGFVSDHICHR
jgi:hypothetical protein